MRCINEVTIYEIDGTEQSGIDAPFIRVNSHWNYSDRFVLEIDNKKYVFVRRDFEKAIDNACNH